MSPRGILSLVFGWFLNIHPTVWFVPSGESVGGWHATPSSFISRNDRHSQEVPGMIPFDADRDVVVMMPILADMPLDHSTSDKCDGHELWGVEPGRAVTILRSQADDCMKLLVRACTMLWVPSRPACSATQTSSPSRIRCSVCCVVTIGILFFIGFSTMVAAGPRFVDSSVLPARLICMCWVRAIWISGISGRRQLSVVCVFDVV